MVILSSIFIAVALTLLLLLVADHSSEFRKVWPHRRDSVGATMNASAAVAAIITAAKIAANFFDERL